MTFDFQKVLQKGKEALEKLREQLKKHRSIMSICLILSAYTLIVFNIPFFKEVFSRVSDNMSGTWIAISLVIVMFVLNFFVYYILLYLGRVVGKFLISATFLTNAACVYFINTYNILIDRTMMENVFNTQTSEASNYITWTLAWYILTLGLIPSIWLFYKKINYGSILRFLANIGVSITLVFGILYSNMSNFPWIDYHATVLGSKVMPWSYIINSMRYYSYWQMMNQKEIILPDAEIATDSKDVFVLIIGESARSENFSLYGYERETNPLMKKDSVTVLNAQASDTYTRSAVKAILSYKPGDTLYEILPNYLNRNGVDVIWRTSNWGSPPIRIEKNYSKSALQERFPEADKNYDGILFHKLKEDIEASDSTKIFIGIHTYTSHGPAYYANVPESDKRFFPECKTVEMSNASHSELINAYDNTILYTDSLVHSVIKTLKEDFPDRRSCVLFVSDHGESLGEGGFYMHGLPKGMAPACQFDIPFIVWTSDSTLKIKDIPQAGHYNIYHSVLGFLGLETPILNEELNIFE